jgi:hypothetical protein
MGANASSLENQLERRVEEQRAKLVELQAQLATIRAEYRATMDKLASYESALVAERKLLGKVTEEVADVSVVEGEPVGCTLKGLSIPKAAWEVLKAANSPLHANEILRRMQAGGWTSEAADVANAVKASLHREHQKRKALFQRVAPSTYALVSDAEV